MERVIITGGGGFIGASLVKRMIARNAEVHLFLRKETNTWRIDHLLNKCKIHMIDIKDRKEVFNIVKRLEPDIIYHLATYGAYHYQEDVNLTIDTNLKGGINLLDASADSTCKMFVNIGSSSEYGIKDKPMKEADLIEPNSIYAITKAAFTHYCRYLSKYHGVPTITLRIFSAYGYYEEPGRLIPTILVSYLQNKAPCLSSPNFVRDFIFIEDVIDAIEIASKTKRVCGEIFNIGTGVQHSIADVVNLTKQILDSDIEPVWGGVKRKNRYEPTLWVADMKKTRMLLKWKHRYSLKEGLRKSVEWFRENLIYYKKNE